MTKDGKIISSIPNVMHISVVKSLLQENWSYQDAWILDRTHLKRLLFFIPLDIFQEITQNRGIDNELEAWLHFLTSTDGITIRKVVEAYPWFLGLYHDLAHFRRHGRELIEMYSDALKTLDYNTVQYMIEDQKKQLAENRKQLAEDRKQLAEDRKQLAENEKQLAEARKKMEEDGKILEEKDEEIKKLKAELAELKKNNA